MLFLLLILLDKCFGLDCSQYSSEVACETETGCIWLSSGNICQCASETNLDIYFGIDKSGSIGIDNFEILRTFLISFTTQGVIPLPQTRIGFIEFSTIASVSSSLTYWNQSELSSFIQNIEYTAGYTNTRDTLTTTIAEFQIYGSVLRSKLLILITDGNPCIRGFCPEDICDLASSVKAENIRVILMLVGDNIDTSYVDCLTENPFTVPNPDILYVTSFSNNSFQSIIPELASIVCPVSYNIKITEVAPIASIPIGTPGGYISRFVEFYNSGIDIYLSAMISEGLIITTDITNGLGNGVIKTNTYGVFFDSDQVSVTCNSQNRKCSCQLSSNNIWCINSTYIPCCDNGCSCRFNDSMSKTDWNIIFKEQDATNNYATLDSAVYDSTFPSILDGYKYVLISKNYDNSIGANWKESCYITGSPGADPFDSCATCSTNTDGSCILSGGICNINTRVCECNDGYYTTGTQCVTIPSPSTCTVTITKDSNETLRAIYAWSSAVISVDKRYVLVLPNVTLTTYSRTQIVKNTIIPNIANIAGYSHFGSIQTEIPPESQSYSSKTECLVITLSPTISPTNMPSIITNIPTTSPTMEPTLNTIVPTNMPTTVTQAPVTTTSGPTNSPIVTLSPTDSPSELPTKLPSISPIISSKDANSSKDNAMSKKTLIWSLIIICTLLILGILGVLYCINLKRKLKQAINENKSLQQPLLNSEHDSLNIDANAALPGQGNTTKLGETGGLNDTNNGELFAHEGQNVQTIGN